MVGVKTLRGFTCDWRTRKISRVSPTSAIIGGILQNVKQNHPRWRQGDVQGMNICLKRKPYISGVA